MITYFINNQSKNIMRKNHFTEKAMHIFNFKTLDKNLVLSKRYVRGYPSEGSGIRRKLLQPQPQALNLLKRSLSYRN